MTNTIKTVEELRANIKANNCIARDIELEPRLLKLNFKPEESLTDLRNFNPL